MSDSPTSEPESAFVCDCEEVMREACTGEPFYRELEDKRYCVLHFPGKEKSADFQQALQRKLENEDFDFRGVWFPDQLPFEEYEFTTKANFSFATFSAEAYFGVATFSAQADFGAATFSAEAHFRTATFSAETNFSFATFSAEAYFSDATFSAKADFRSATFSAVADFSFAKFSVESDFSSAKFSAEADFSAAIFRAKADFSCATFSAKADFTRATFNAEADFISATFRARADFTRATFNAEAYFSSATFSNEAYFSFATFSAGAHFRSATFSAAADFYWATFSYEAAFSSATFSAAADFSAAFSAAAYFRSATFGDQVRFAGTENRPVFTDTSQLDLQFARIEKPDRVSFHTLSLRPHWFVNIDARKFGFTNVNWGRPSINEETSRLEKNDISSPHPLLAIACRNLAVNAEENHRYEEASKFRYMAMEARRLESWRGFAPWRLSWWYWLASGYGERVGQAFFVLLGILLLSALLYNHVGFARWEPKVASESDVVVARRDDVGAPLKFSRALTYSAGVMTFQKPEPRPATTAAQTVVLLETILGPVQAALLALAIRRKFMR